jgi:Zn-dependent protease
LQDINLVQVLIAFLVLVFSLTVHESAHAWTAGRLGDPTGRRLGRVSLNPAAHVDPVGTLLFPLLAMITHLPIIGWARPVPVDARYLRNPRRDFLFIAAAGPLSNLALAVVAAAALRAVPAEPEAIGRMAVAAPLALVASVGLQINLLLAIFNMIPVPPLDGSSVVAGLVPERVAAGLDRLRPYGFLVLYGLMLTGALGYLVGPPFNWMLSWLL